MKSFITVFCVVFFLLMNGACRKASTEMTNKKVDTAAHVTLSGTFVNGPFGNVSGLAKIYLQNDKYYLALEGFSSSNGPDLKVYLSQEIIPLNYIKLGNLKSTSGNHVYEIFTIPDFKKYKYALIHCEQYNHLFGSAELK